MNKTLEKFGFHYDYPSFTLYLNEKFKIYDHEDFCDLIENDPRGFFSTIDCRNFYKTILRDLKVELCLSCPNVE